MFSLFSLHMYDFSCIMNSLDLGYVPDDSYPKSHLEDIVLSSSCNLNF